MPEKPGPERPSPESLRTRAEARLRAGTADVTNLPPEDLATLVQELQVHQVELEIQNEELRGAHAQLAASHDRLADLYDYAPVGYLTLGGNGEVLHCNHTATHMLGVDRVVLLHSDIRDFVAPGGQDPFYFHVQKVLAGDGRQVAEVPMKTAKGDLRQVRLESRRSENREEAASAAIRMALVDVTERQEAEEALQGSEERLRLAAAATGFGTYDYDPRRRRTFWSRELYKISGLPEPEGDEQPSFLELIHPEDQERFYRLVQEAVLPGGPGRHEIEFRIVRPDGETRWVRDTGLTIFEGEGAERSAVRVVGTVQDITQRKEAAEELRSLNEELEARVRKRAEALRRLSQVFRDAANPIIIEDLSGVVLEVNEEVERLFGWRREELVGRSIKTIVPEDRHGQVDELLAACRRGESVRNVEGVRMTRDGEEIPVLLTLSLLASGDGEPDAIASIAKDLRELKAVERSLQESRAVAEMHRDIAYMANTASDLEEAVQFCLETVAHYNGWAFGHAYFPANHDPELLAPSASHHAASPERFRKFMEESSRLLIKRGQGLPGRVFASGKPQWSTDVQAELADRRSAMAEDLGIETVAAFPILVGEQVVGVLEFFADQIIDVDSRLEESMAAIGAQLGRVVERNIAEQELRASGELLRQLTGQLRDVVWMHDAETFEILYCNVAFEKIFGRSRTVLDDDPRAFLDSVHPRDRKRVREAVERMLGGEDLDEEFRLVRPDGTIRWLRDRGFAIRDSDGRIYRFAGTAEDITQRRAAQEEMKRLEREITEAAEEERHRLAQDLHDSVGALLSAVNLRLKVLEEDLSEGKPAESGAIEAIASLTEQAIAQTRAVTRGMHPVGTDPEDLMDALRDLAASVRTHAGLHCRFLCSRPVRVENHHVANQLFRIAQEAVNNAVKHSGGSRLCVGLRRNDEGIILFVKDNGKGLDPEDGGKQAAGLGLRILRYRAATIGAALEVAPRKKAGTKMVCTLREVED